MLRTKVNNVHVNGHVYVLNNMILLSNSKNE